MLDTVIVLQHNTQLCDYREEVMMSVNINPSSQPLSITFHTFHTVVQEVYCTVPFELCRSPRFGPHPQRSDGHGFVILKVSFLPRRSSPSFSTSGLAPI